MVSDLELPAKNISLEQQLEAVKLELLRTQARLHHWQETSVAEAAFLQLRSQYFQAQYELWVMKASVAWARGEVTRMTVCLESSLDCTVLEAQVVVADWLKRLNEFAREKQSVETSKFELEVLINSPEWRLLAKKAITEKRTTKAP